MTLPRVAYILLWFPKPSETFIFSEVMNLWKMGLPLKVYTLYGELTKDLSPEMASVSNKVERLGIPYLKRGLADLLYWRKRDPETTSWLLRTIPVRKWRSFEVAGENVWAFFCGFTLARLFEADGIDHIHAPWANGPATAAWVAAKLLGIPFSFTGRAHDICPPDGALREKVTESAFVTTNNSKNLHLFRLHAAAGPEKVHLIYNGITLNSFKEAPVPMNPPYHILALGRLVRVKGFDILIRAAKLLDEAGIDFRLTIAGSGPRSLALKFLARRLGLSDKISFPGHIIHDKVSDLMATADLLVVSSIVMYSSGHREGIPNVIMEALLHRLPVIATNLSAMGDVIVHEETGLLTAPGDAWDLAQAIWAIVGDREKALAMAEKGRTRVLKQFDPEQNFGKIFKLFLEHAKPSTISP